jgi:hypothetical protein
MTKTWRFHPEVAAEVEAAARWYEKERTGLGVEFALTVNAVIATLKAMPSLGSTIADAPRRRPIRRVFFRASPTRSSSWSRATSTSCSPYLTCVASPTTGASGSTTRERRHVALPP